MAAILKATSEKLSIDMHGEAGVAVGICVHMCACRHVGMVHHACVSSWRLHALLCSQRASTNAVMLTTTFVKVSNVMRGDSVAAVGACADVGTPPRLPMHPLQVGASMAQFIDTELLRAPSF